MRERPKYTLAEYYKAAKVEGDYEWAERMQMSFKPYAHQISGLRNALAYNRYGIYDQPGLGKSVIAQAYAMHYASYGSKVVIIMPPSLTQQFNNTFRSNFSNFDDKFNTHVLKQGPKTRLSFYNKWDEKDSWPDILLMSYEMFRLTWDIVQDLGGYKVLIADEAHKLKTPESNQHKAVVGFLGPVVDATALMLMTGTPIPNTLEDCYGMIKLITPEEYRNKAQFEREHMIFRRIHKPAKPGQRRSKSFLVCCGFKGRETLHDRLYLQSRRVLKDNIFVLGKPLIQELDVQLSLMHQKLYTRLVRERVLLLEDELIDATNASSLRQKCLRMVTNPDRFSDHARPIENLVLKAVDDKLEQIGEHEKVVLVGHFRETIELLAEHYHRRNPAVLYGGTLGPPQRQIDKFCEDETCKMIIIHPESGGVGVDGFQHVCKYMIFVEPTSVPGQFIQTTERLVRPGQKHVVTVWILKVAGTISPRMTSEMLRKSRDTRRVTMDRTSMLSDLMGAVPR